MVAGAFAANELITPSTQAGQVRVATCAAFKSAHAHMELLHLLHTDL